MPPRRSSRAVSGSLATPPIETLPIKRKRGQRAAPTDIDEEAAPIPNRRRTRAASASLTTPIIETLPVKRKRGQKAAPIDIDEEAPPSSNRRRTTPKSEKEDSDDDSDIPGPPVTQPPSQQLNGSANTAHVVSNT